MAVYKTFKTACLDAYTWFIKSDMNYVLLVPKNSIRGLKMSFPVNFRFISG